MTDYVQKALAAGISEERIDATAEAMEGLIRLRAKMSNVDDHLFTECVLLATAGFLESINHHELCESLMQWIANARLTIPAVPPSAALN